MAYAPSPHVVIIRRSHHSFPVPADRNAGHKFIVPQRFGHLMPGGNGMSFLVRAREEFPQMQRILVTGYMKPEMLIRSVNEAALFRYLLKPVALAELIKVVQEAAAAASA